jgi:uncharacterized PurR-regulated membrane protein YhhQ (DUF165 family)
VIQRIVATIIAIAAMAAAAGVVVVAIAFAVYTVLRDYLGPAGAAAVIAAVFAAVLAVTSFVMFGRAKHPHPAKPVHEPSFAERTAEFLRARPLAAAGAAVAAGLIAWRNPRLVTTLMTLLEARDRRDRP